MNYLLEIVIFNVIIYTICGINIAKKGKLGMIQEYPKAIQDRCRELGLIQESSGKLKKKATIGKLGLFIGYIFLQTVLAYYIGGARTFSEGWFEGVISPAYINLRAKSGYSSRFYDYYFKTQYWSMAMFAHGKGVSFENRWTLGIEELFNYKIPVPLENEQDKIADFLDEQCEKINLAIEKAKVSIEEYRNLKQSFITQIVTKGINENDTMKESGIEWIGKIPASWKVTQLRHCASIRSGITLGKTYSKDTELVEMPYLRVANVQDGYVDTNDIAVLQVSKDEIEKYSLSAGEVLMTEGGDRDKLGRGCVWDGRITPCLHQNHIFAVKVKEKLLNPHYLEYLTASSVGRTYFDVTAVKTTNLACTSSSKVLAFTIPLPSIDEQNEIVDYLKEKCGCIENVIFKKEQFISELENYKKSLIYEYVTGKKEVPEI